MKVKLQFGIVVLLLALLTTFFEKTTVPNQQIVIQFSDAKISSEEAEITISTVKAQLTRIGATNIQIGQSENGKLRITYYSEADVERIQNILSEEDGFKLAHQSSSSSSNDFPENRNLKKYELDISELRNQSDIYLDFEGVQIVELIQKRDGLKQLKLNAAGERRNIERCKTEVKVAIQVSVAANLTTDNDSYKIPEVRAGPSHWGSSI